MTRRSLLSTFLGASSAATAAPIPIEKPARLHINGRVLKVGGANHLVWTLDGRKVYLPIFDEPPSQEN